MKHVSSRKLEEYHKNIMRRRMRSAKKRPLPVGRETAKLAGYIKTRSWRTAPLMKWWWYFHEWGY